MSYMFISILILFRSEYTQIGENDLVTLLLDNFILPHWESIDILQSGDLVTVIRNKTKQSAVESGTEMESGFLESPSPCL